MAFITVTIDGETRPIQVYPYRDMKLKDGECEFCFNSGKICIDLGVLDFREFFCHCTIGLQFKDFDKFNQDLRDYYGLKS